MRPASKGYFLKEYGSWSVLSVAFLLGVLVSRSFTWSVLPLYLSFALLINSKQAFMKWLRKTDDRQSLLIFLAQIGIATVILLAIFRSDIPRLLPLLVVPAAYLIVNKLKGEHFILTELLGFALLSLAAVIAHFLLTNELDLRLYIGTALYFTAGVFKVKSLLMKRTADRIWCVLYVVLSTFAYDRFNISLFILLPLIDNVMAAVTLYKVRLQTTGWIEVAKSILFLALFVRLY